MKNKNAYAAKWGRRFWFALLFVCAAAPRFTLRAQEKPAGAAGVNAAPAAPGAKFRIEKIAYRIEGRTKEFALAAYAKIAAGTEFSGIQELEEYTRQKTRLLLNNRIFADAKIEYTLGEETDGARAVNLCVSVNDTRNFLIVPYPKYDTNTGFLFRFRLWDKNAFGGMNLLQGDLGYTYMPDIRQHGFLFDFETTVPFAARGFIWNIDVRSKNRWTLDVERPFVSDSAAGLSVNIPAGRSVFTPGFRERAVITAKNELSEMDFEDSVFFSDTRISKHAYLTGAKGILLDEWYISSIPYIKWTLPSGIVCNNAEIVYETLMSGAFASVPDGRVSDAHKGINIEFNHRLGLSQINWLGNFRDGYYAYIQNDIIYNAEYTDVNAYVSFTAAVYKKWTNFFGTAARLSYKHWFETNADWTLQSAAEAGSVIRGVKDRALLAKSALALNLELPFRLFVFMPSEWFNTRKMRYFDFELHFSPILDFAFIDGVQYNEKYIPVKTPRFTFDDIYIGAGAAFLVYPFAWRSLFLRLSAAVNLRDVLNEGSLTADGGAEIFFGIGHYF